MENPASTEKETYTEEGATATPPGNEFLIIKPHIYLSHVLE